MKTFFLREVQGYKNLAIIIEDMRSFTARDLPILDYDITDLTDIRIACGRQDKLISGEIRFDVPDDVITNKMYTITATISASQNGKAKVTHFLVDPKIN
jgi:hypothetical protein